MKTWVGGLVAVLLVPQLAFAGINYDGSGRAYPTGGSEPLTQTDGIVIGVTTVAAVILYNSGASFLAALAAPVGIVYGAWRVQEHRQELASNPIRVNIANRCAEAKTAGTTQNWMVNQDC